VLDAKWTYGIALFGTQDKQERKKEKKKTLMGFLKIFDWALKKPFCEMETRTTLLLDCPFSVLSYIFLFFTVDTVGIFDTAISDKQFRDTLYFGKSV